MNSFGEAILDPRFIEKCSYHGAGKTSIVIPKPETNSLSFEQIVKKELDEVRGVEEILNIPDRKMIKKSERYYRKIPSSIDQDEGFFDRSLSSPCSEGHITQTRDESD